MRNIKLPTEKNKPQLQKRRELATTATATIASEMMTHHQAQKFLRCPSEEEYELNRFVTHHISTCCLIFCLGRKKYIYMCP